jgi:uncharacterized protein YjaZ
MKRLYFIIVLLLTGVVSFSQLRQIPKVVQENFAQQYPMAKDVDFHDDLFDVNVKFILDGDQMNAEYNNKGMWRRTEKRWTYDNLPDAVQDGFKKSKYADREVKEVTVIYYPGDIIQYRLKTEKSAVEKKYLYFNSQGRLMRESITI